MARKKITQKEIASSLGVSQAAVSAVINDPETGTVSDDTKRRIFSFIEAVGYKTPRMRMGGTIAFIGKFDASGYSQEQLLLGVKKVAKETRRNLTVIDTETQDLSPLLENHLVRGAILSTSIDRLLSDMLRKKMPVVQLNYCTLPGNCDSVISNDQEGLYRAVSYLFKCGHRRIGYISFPTESPDYSASLHFRQRFEGYLCALRCFGLSVPQSIRKIFRLDLPGVMLEEGLGDLSHTLERMFTEVDPVTAIITYNDLLAWDVIKTAEYMGKKVPDDLSVIGIDNWPAYSPDLPRLTTLDLHWPAMGQIAANILCQRFSDTQQDSLPFTQTACAPTLLEGETVAPPRQPGNGS